MSRSHRFDTNELTLRPFTKEDASALFELTRQTEITDILPDWNMTEQQLDDFLDFVISSYETFNPGDVRILLAMEHREDKQLIGWCGVFPNDMLNEADREVAYALSKDYRNQGFATEAVIGMVSHILNHSLLEQIVAIVKPFNKASIRVIEKAGFKKLRRITLSDKADYDYFTLVRNPIKPVSLAEIDPYLDLMAEVEHTQLDRRNPSHERWLRNRIRSYYDRGAEIFVYHDSQNEERFGIIAILHEEAPEGIDALGARAEVLHIGVSMAARRHGVGSILLKYAEDFAKVRGVYCLFMMTYAEDYDVIAFYGKNGFIPVATLPDVYGPSFEGNVFLRKIIR
ncbi:GNAT family N-acetyltransferase [Cohnella sp. WQ 127256]|uniref:GNAT family N-acetyltransferase n=1 Tax=Cohnella sp. WQ 127256 TaxID=2938790 RepID=UPI002118537F|nr:GNAT family N-acetyltransferase [Cohnella sp. WQ 127256]